MNDKRFYLSERDKKIGGACGGIAEYFDIDPLLVRVLFLVSILEIGVGLFTYIALWLLAPRNPNRY